MPKITAEDIDQRREVVELLRAAGIEAAAEELAEKLEIPPKPEFGDLAFPCFDLAKLQKRSPQSIAKNIAKKIKIPKGSVVAKVEAKAGYVNFFFDWQKLAEIVLKKILKSGADFGRLPAKGKVAVVDYSSPNPAHPIHVGSARTTFIGESLCRILAAAGYAVKRICYVNDLGKQVAKLLWGYKKFAAGAEPDKKPDHWLFDIYVKANEAISSDAKVEKEVEAILRKCEAGDAKLLGLVKKLVEWCLQGFKETYERIGVKFDEYLWESKFIKNSKKYVNKLLESKHAFKTEDGAVVIDLEMHGLPSTIILRSDGTGLYLTRDIAATLYKFEKYKPQLNVFVVAEDQRLHFQQQFKILELLGYEEFAKNCVHVSYGYVTLPEGKLSSRAGRVVLIDDVLDEAVKRVKESYTEDEKIAEAVGVGAVIYSILKIEPNKQVTFKWEEALRLEGNTGPYLQYAHTRCASILKKAKKWRPRFKTEKLTDQEKELIKILLKFPDVVYDAAKDLHPHYICNYAYNLATAFSAFYQFCPVLKAEREEQKNFRLSLVQATKIVLANALKLIGIEAVEKM